MSKAFVGVNYDNKYQLTIFIYLFLFSISESVQY